MNGRWFDRTQFITGDEQAAAVGVIDRVVDAARAWVESSRDRLAVLVTGSLARGEATVRQQGPRRWYLASDFDFVVVGPDPESAESGCQALVHHLRKSAGSCELSAFPVAENDLDHTRSFFGQDLRLAVGRPDTHFGRGLAIPLPSPITQAHRLEVVVHHTSNLLLNDQIFPGRSHSNRDAIDEQRRKLAVECLRACQPPDRHVLRYADALVSRGCASVAPGLASRIVRLRETGQGEDLDDQELGFVIHSTLDHILCVESPHGDSLSTTESALAVHYAAGTSVIDTYSFLMLAALLRRYVGVNRNSPPDGAVSTQLGRSPNLAEEPSTVSRVATAFMLGRLTPGDASVLMEWRARYYGVIGASNFGRTRPE